jgi:predicted Rossmann fold flavoprotein
VKKSYDLIVVGGGAAGFFTAIQCKEHNANLSVLILEQSKNVLNKVRISGGGRCNVTNSIWDPKELVKYYPRGEKELLGPFSKFACGDTMAWFEERGVDLKIEEDGRVFPVSDNSESIAACLLLHVNKHGIKVSTNAKVKNFSINGDGYTIQVNNEDIDCKHLMLAPGSSPFFLDLMASKGYQIVPPLPSLFTFNTKDPRLSGLMGLSVSNVGVSVAGTALSSDGPILITHWGLSGPAILKLSAWGARVLHELQYKFTIEIDWMPHCTEDEIRKMKHSFGAKTIVANPLGGLPIRLWKSLLSMCLLIHEGLKWADVKKDGIDELISNIKHCQFFINGKSTFKEEFVTAGGVDLKQINFNTFESKLHKGLYMGGEIIDIDAITGGFNFQAAWTAGFLAGRAIGTSHK